jgi:hypothetical protein
MAKKASVMNMKYSKFYLTFEGFQLEFLVDLGESIEESERYSRASASDFVFARGEIWLLSYSARHRVLDQKSGGNLLETLGAIATKMKVLPEIEAGKYFVDCGGWGPWMRGYWARFLNDVPEPDDDLKHDFLVKCLLDEGDGGALAAYRVNASAVIEVCLPSKRTSNEPVVEVWSYFDVLQTRNKIGQIRSAMASAIAAVG